MRRPLALELDWDWTPRKENRVKSRHYGPILAELYNQEAVWEQKRGVASLLPLSLQCPYQESTEVTNDYEAMQLADAESDDIE